MLLKRGIVRKTFLFSSLLILFVVLISFAAMYFIMPGYYLTQKDKMLRSSLDALTLNLRSAETEEACAALISGFSAQNNVIVLSFDENKSLLPGISTPFLGLRDDNAVFLSTEEQHETSGDRIYRIQIRSSKRMEGEPSLAMEPDFATDTGFTVMWSEDAAGENVISIDRVIGIPMVDHVIVTGTLQPIGEAKDVILSLMPYVLAIAIVAGLILSGVYARQISKPILQISDAALKMQRMEPGIASGIQTKDELGQLSDNLDVLYAKLLENIGYLKSEMDKVNRLERSKTELMQNASHELKTPIAALSGMLEGMIDHVGAYKNKEKYLVECKCQVDKLSHLVAEILGASKSDLAGQELELSEVSADELVRRAIAENLYQIQRKNLRLESDLPETLLTTDPAILFHSISNLISNAVRYTPHNREIRVTITGEGAQRRLTIENACEPIPPEEIPKLFEPFYTRSYNRDKTKSGTGLGLYIAKRSLERLEIPYEAASAGLGFRIRLEI